MDQYEGKLPLDLISLPAGFSIDIYAQGVVNARSLCLSPAGTLFVSTRSDGRVYAIQDHDRDYKADTMYTLMEGGNMPNGVAFKDGDLYIAEVNRILKFRDIENRLANPGKPEIVFDQYPTDSHHGWKYISFGPDGKLYVPVGAPCNICESENEIYNTITRLNADGTGMEIVHRGIRNTVGFTWHPVTKELWFTDNGRDWMGDYEPACELNHAPRDGMHFGYPYCHQGDIPDPEYGDKRDCNEFSAPAQNLGAHVAPLGCEFYDDELFPEQFKHQMFIAEHGSWNSSTKVGYQISLVRFNNGEAISYEPFASGWLKEDNNVWGRPVDLEFLPDGSMLVSDDFADVIYRISYSGN
jgi:glucose/arabinose dehydrogenase